MSRICARTFFNTIKSFIQDLRKKNWKLIEALQVAQTSSSKNNDISNMNVVSFN